MDRSKVGAYVGQGCRVVYQYGDDAVIKFACPSRNQEALQNIAEGAVWARYRDTDHARYFAPVLEVAEDGAWLVMARAVPLSPREHARADAMQMMLHGQGIRVYDIDTDNVGTYNDRTVLIDYGLHVDYPAPWEVESGDKCGQCDFCRDAHNPYALA